MAWEQMGGVSFLPLGLPRLALWRQPALASSMATTVVSDDSPSPDYGLRGEEPFP